MYDTGVFWSSQTYFAMCGIDVLWIIQTYKVMYDTGVFWSSQTYFAMCGIDGQIHPHNQPETEQ